MYHLCPSHPTCLPVPLFADPYALKYPSPPWDFLSKRIIVDAPLVNRCIQPGSFARNRLYSNLHADPPSPRIPVRRLPAGCCIDWSAYTYLRHKMFWHKGKTARDSMIHARARPRSRNVSDRRRSSFSWSMINLHFVKLTFRKSFTTRRPVYCYREGEGNVLFTGQGDCERCAGARARSRVKLYNASYSESLVLLLPATTRRFKGYLAIRPIRRRGFLPLALPHSRMRYTRPCVIVSDALEPRGRTGDPLRVLWPLGGFRASPLTNRLIHGLGDIAST